MTPLFSVIAIDQLIASPTNPRKTFDPASMAELTASVTAQGVVTTMGQALAETYARAPFFYSGTFCAGCRTHFPVGEDGEFVWDGTTDKVGT